MRKLPFIAAISILVTACGGPPSAKMGKLADQVREKLADEKLCLEIGATQKISNSGAPLFVPRRNRGFSAVTQAFQIKKNSAEDWADLLEAGIVRESEGVPGAFELMVTEKDGLQSIRSMVGPHYRLCAGRLAVEPKSLSEVEILENPFAGAVHVVHLTADLQWKDIPKWGEQLNPNRMEASQFQNPQPIEKRFSFVWKEGLSDWTLDGM